MQEQWEVIEKIHGIFVVAKKQENKEDSLRLLFLERICLPNAQRL